MSDIRDLLSATINQKPSEFATTFNDLLLNKLETAISNKKMEIAQNMIVNKVESEETPEEEPTDA